MKIALLAVTEPGLRLAERLARELPRAVVIRDIEQRGIAATVRSLWPQYDGLVFIMAAGIVVRAIAPLAADKHSDPCVVVVDQLGKYAISLLSGHLGGGNRLATRVAAMLGGEAVITTASDALGLTALDLWAAGQGLVVADKAALTRASAKLVNTGRLRIFSDLTGEGLPDDFIITPRPEEADIIVSNRTGWPETAAVFHPRNLVVGIGCNRGTGPERIESCAAAACADNGLAFSAIRNAASIDLKRDEQGLLDFAERHGLRIDFYTREQLNGVAHVDRSAAVYKATGAFAVAEPAALLSAGTDKLLVRKMKWNDVTVAVAEADFRLSAPAREA